MSEPVLWRGPAGRVAAASCRPKRSRFSPIVSIFSTCSLFALLLGGVPVHAQNVDPQVRYSIESPKAVSHLLLDVAHAGNRLVVAGDHGHILYSDDGGANWTQAKVPTRQLLTAIHFIDDQHGWAVGHDALILATADGGATWTRQYENREAEVPLLDVWFGNPQHGLAVGAYGMLLETLDGGQHWEDVTDRLDNEDGFHLNAISEIGGSGLFIVGEMGGMFRSHDMGQSWERVEAPYEGSFFGVLGGGEPALVLAYGLRGHLFRSTDFGDSWKQVDVSDGGRPLRSGLAGGSLLDDGRIVIVGHGGAVLTSQDRGESFNVIHRGDRRSLAGAVSNEQGNLILVGQGGVRVADATGEEPGQ